MPIDTCAGVQYAIAPDHLGAGIGKKNVGIAAALTQSRHRGSVDADRNRLNSRACSLSRLFSIPRNSELQNGHQLPR
jgi:hypothetical protein